MLPPAGEARSRLQWADGKSIKNEVDLQVGAGRALPIPWGCGAGDSSSCVGAGQAAGHGAALRPRGVVQRCFFSQVLHLLGPKTEADLEKKPKVMQGGRLGAGMVFFWLCSPGHTRGRALGWFPALCVVPLLLGCPAAAPGWGQGSWEGARWSRVLRLCSSLQATKARPVQEEKQKAPVVENGEGSVTSQPSGSWDSAPGASWAVLGQLALLGALPLSRQAALLSHILSFVGKK